MKRFLLLLVVFAMCISPVFSQTVIFSEDFESGTPSTEWGLYRVAEEPILAIPMRMGIGSVGDTVRCPAHMADA